MGKDKYKSLMDKELFYGCAKKVVFEMEICIDDDAGVGRLLVKWQQEHWNIT